LTERKKLCTFAANENEMRGLNNDDRPVFDPRRVEKEMEALFWEGLNIFHGRKDEQEERATIQVASDEVEAAYQKLMNTIKEKQHETI